MAIEIRHSGETVVVESSISSVVVNNRQNTVGVVSGVLVGDPPNDYERLRNKPSIESVELKGDKSISDFGVSVATDYDIALLFR